MRPIVVLLFALLASPTSGWAQSTSAGTGSAGQAAAGSAKSSFETFSKYVQVRKAFDGGKAETEAGAIGLVAPGKDSKTYWLVDAAVRTTPLNWQINSSGTLETFFFPSAEWHHMSTEPLLEQKETNKAGGGLNVELWFPPFSGWRLREGLIGKANLTRNLVRDTTERSASLLLETCAEGVETHEDQGWEGGFRPCAELTYQGARRMHYYPYVGFERYTKLAIQSSDAVVAPAFDGSTFVVRVQGDVYPFSEELIPGNIDGLAFNFDYAYRRVVSDATDLTSSNLNLFKFSATYFFVKGQAVGVGVTTEFGSSPAVNFVSQRRIVLAFRVKTKS